MHSHSSLVKGALRTFIKEITRDECLKIHLHGSLRTITGLIVDNIKPNASTMFHDETAGYTFGDARCHGGRFTDGKNQWDNVVVQYSVTLTIRDFTASVIAS